MKLRCLLLCYLMEMGEKFGIGNQEYFGKLTASLKTNLFTGVKSLSLPDLLVRPPERFAVLGGDVQTESHESN